MPPSADRSEPASRGRWPRILLLGGFVAAVALFVALGGTRYLDLDAVKAHRETLRACTERHYTLALLLAFLVYTGVVALSVPGATVLSLVAGFLFGPWVGTPLVLLAATLGATLVFLGARYVFADWARRRMGAIGARINAGIRADAFGYLLFLRLVPLFPFFLVNLAAAFAAIPTRTYVLATALGIVPATFIYVSLGGALGQIDSLHGLFSAPLLAGLTLLALLALLPVWVRRRQRRTRSGP